MKDHLISLFIDDELGLDEKIDFVETLHGDGAFKNAAVDLLHQEKLLRSEVVDRVPSLALPEPRKPLWHRFFKPLAAAAAGLAIVVAVLLQTDRPPQGPPARPHRFVVYLPEAKRVEITGSFTGWKKLPLRPAAGGEYWEITLELPAGEHRFSYVLEGNRRMTDPTIAVREADDFGGENSILAVKNS